MEGKFHFFSKPWVVLLLVFVLALSVRSIPLHFSGSFDPDTHFHARLSNDIARTHQIPTWDALSLQGRVYSYPPLLHVLTGLLSMLSGIDSLDVLKVLGLLVGALMVISTYLLGQSLSGSRSIGLWAGFFASLSVMAIWRTAGFTRPDGIAMMMIPFLLYLWVERQSVLATVLSVAMVLLHPLSAVIYAALLGSYFLLQLFQKKRVSFWIPIALGAMLVTFFLWVFSIGLPLSNYASHISLDATELSKFWLLGLILFFPISWAFNFVGAWKGKLPIVLIVWSVLTLAIGSLGMRLAIYMIPFLGIVGAYGVHYLISSYRSIKVVLPALAFFVIVLGMGGIWIAMNAETPYFTTAEKAGIDFLGQNAVHGSSVLTTWDQGHVLAYYTGLPMVIDGYFEFAHELDERNRIMKNALQTSRCDTFTESLDAFHARYYYLPKDELLSDSAKWGVLEMPACEPIRLLFSSDYARVYERIPSVKIPN